MILTCPQCQTRYQTDAAMFGAEGRKVRCAKCGHVWLQVALPETDQMDSEPPTVAPVGPELAANAPSAAQHAKSAATTALPAYSPATDAPILRSIRPDFLAMAGGWLALATLIVAVGWSAMRFREEIAILWPQTASFYAALGEPVNTRGLKIEKLSYRRESRDGQVVLAVTGRLTNVTSHELSVPPIQITLTDGNRRVLYDWSFSPNVATLKAGQAINFLTRLSSPPSGATHMQAHFAENKE